MLNKRTKELIICMLAVLFLLITITTNVFADDMQDIEDLLDEESEELTQIEDRTEVENIVENETEEDDENVANLANNTANLTNNSANNTTTIPDTGLDYSIVFVIAICGIAALYAYKKIREYNV